MAEARTRRSVSTFPDAELAYRAVSSRDPRFDGRLYVGVLSTGVYCRPSCPSRTPLPENCVFHRSAAACVSAGFRACRRCRPDAQPGSRDWDLDADLAGRALRLVEQGVVDDEGVAGLAARLAVSPRHLHRLLVAQLGASPVDLARTRRAQLARMLIDETDLPLGQVAFAAGFRSVRQFNDVMREHVGAPPSSLRRAQREGSLVDGPDAGEATEPAVASAATPTTGRAGAGVRVTGGSSSVGSVGSVGSAGSPAPAGSLGPAARVAPTLELRLRLRAPLDADAWLAHVAARAVPGLEEVRGAVVRRVLPGRVGPVLAELDVSEGVRASLVMPDMDGLSRVVGRLRHWADLDAHPGRVDEVLAEDPLLAPLVAAHPGLRVPGTVDPAELAMRTVLGQQVSIAGARTLTARLVAALGVATPWGLAQFPTPAAVARAGVEGLRALGLTGVRAGALAALAEALDSGLDVGPGADRARSRAVLGALPGVGPWTVDYVALRAMGDPDAFPAHDLVLRRALGGVSPAEARRRAERWRPWRGYAAQHLWTSRAATRGEAV